MSDSPFGPSEQELVELGFTADAGDVESMLKGLRDDLGEVQDVVDRINTGAESAASAFVDGWSQVIAMAKEGNQNLITFNEMLGQTAQLVGQIKDSGINELGGVGAAQPGFGALHAGYGAEGGLIGPAEDTGDDGSGGSLYGVARGFRAGAGIGRLAGLGPETTAGFTGAADIIYLQQGFQKLSEILPALNDQIQKAGEGLPVVGGLFEQFGGGLSSLALVAVPAAAALALIVAGIAAIEAEVKKDEATLKNVISAQETYYDTVANGTTASVQAEIDKEQAIRDGQKKTLDQLQGQYKDLQEQQALAAAHGDLVNAAAIGANMKLLGDQIQAIQPQVDGSTSKLNALEQALQGLAANDAAEAARQAADEMVKQTATYAADDKLTTDAIKQKIEVLSQDAESQRAAANMIEATNDALDKNSTQYQDNIKAIDAHRTAAANDEAEIQHLTQTSTVLAQQRDAEKQRTDDLKKAIDDYIKDMDQQQKIQDQINTDQQKWAQQAADTIAARNEQASQQTIDFYVNRAQQINDFNAQEAEAEQTYQEQRLEKTQAFQDSIAQIEDNAANQQAKDIQNYQVQQAQAAQAFANKIRDINDQAHESELQDAANLDARKLAQDIEKAAQATNKATEQYNQERQQRQQEEERKLTELAQNENREIAQRTAAFQRQLALDDQHEEERKEKAEEKFKEQQLKEDQHFAQQMKRQMDQWDKQDKATADQHAQELALLKQHLAEITNAQTDAWNRILRNTNLDMNALDNIILGNIQNMQTAAQNIFNQVQQAQGSGSGTGGIPSSTSTSSSSNNLPFFGGLFAEGGTVPGVPSEERLIMAGENGPELLRVPGSTQVYNNQQTNQVLGGRSANITNHFHLYDVGKRSDAEIIALSEQGVSSAFDKMLAELEGKQL